MEDEEIPFKPFKGLVTFDGNKRLIKADSYQTLLDEISMRFDNLKNVPF